MKLRTAFEAGLGAVDTVEFFCSEELVCPNVIGNTLVKADPAHISGQFSNAWGAVLAREVLESLENRRAESPEG